MRILLVVSSYLPNIGGLQAVTSQLTHQLQMLGHQVTVLAQHYPYQLSGASLCSSCPRSSSPYTLLKAISCCKPVVVGRVGGVTEMIANGETDSLFESGSAEALPDATVRLLQSPAHRAAPGQAARQVVLRRYSIDIGVEATETSYRDVLSTSREASL